MEQEVTLPIYSYDEQEIFNRKNAFVNVGKQMYRNVPTLTANTYRLLARRFNDGDKTVVNKLITLSLQTAIENVAQIYAKYDVEEIVPFEEAMSGCVEAITKSINTLDYLSTSHWDFKSRINISVFHAFCKMYAKECYELDKCETMSPLSMTYEINKRENVDFDNSLLIKEARGRLIKAMTKLGPRKARVLSLRYGLDDGNPLTLEEVGQTEHVVRSRIDQIVAASFKKIRKPKNIKVLNIYKDLDFSLN